MSDEEDVFHIAMEPIILLNNNDADVATLQEAAFFGDADTVVGLLDSGFDVNSINNNGFCALHYTAMRGDTATARILIRRHANVTTTTTHSRETAMHLAARFGRTAFLRMLRNYGVSVNLLDSSNDGATPLHSALGNGQCRAGKWLLENGACANMPTKNGISPLFYAVESNYPHTVKLLIYHGVNVHTVSENLEGYTPLHVAARIGNEEIVEMLLVHGAQPDVYALRINLTPVHMAARKGHVHLFQRFAEFQKHKALKSKCADGNCPIHYAVKYGHIPMVKWLLDNGVPIECFNGSGFAPLHVASENGHVAMVEFLISKGAKPNSWTSGPSKLTALGVAISQGKHGVVDMLLLKGARVKERCYGGKSAMRVAVQVNDTNLIQLLQNFGATIDVERECSLEESLLVTAIEYDSEEAALWLLRRRVDINARNTNVRNPLHLCAELGNATIAGHLIRAGAHVNAGDKALHTPLHLAVLNGHASIVEVLLKTVADVHATNDEGVTPLHMAALTGNLDCLKKLCSRGGNVRVRTRNRSRERPIHVAAARGHLNVVRWIIKQKETVDVRNRHGHTPLTKAALHGHYDVVEFLIASGADVNIRVGSNTPRNLASEIGHSDVTELLMPFNVKMTLQTDGSKHVHRH